MVAEIVQYTLIEHSTISVRLKVLDNLTNIVVELAWCGQITRF